MFDVAIRNHRYEVSCSFKQKEIVKSAGFKWDPIKKVWYTPDPAVANKIGKIQPNPSKRGGVDFTKRVHATLNNRPCVFCGCKDWEILGENRISAIRCIKCKHIELEVFFEKDR